MFCVVYGNVWARSKLMYVTILLHLVLGMQSTMCVGVATLKLNNEYCNSMLHKNDPIMCVTGKIVCRNTGCGTYVYAIVEICI